MKFHLPPLTIEFFTSKLIHTILKDDLEAAAKDLVAERKIGRVDNIIEIYVEKTFSN